MKWPAGYMDSPGKWKTVCMCVECVVLATSYESTQKLLPSELNACVLKPFRPRGSQRKLRVRLSKKIVRPDKYARKMLWTVGNGES